MRDMFQLRRFAESLSAMESSFRENRKQPSESGSTKNRHSDHEISFLKGGSSLSAANVRLLCAKHNLENGADEISDLVGKVVSVVSRE